MKTAAILVMVASAASSHANALSAREAAELQALCDLNPQATGTTRSICDALDGGQDPCGIAWERHLDEDHTIWMPLPEVICSPEGHLVYL
jgi:hypothetical protein